MPVWAWIAVGAGGVLVACALAIAAVYAWRGMERRYALRIVSRGEALDAVRQALGDALQRLAGETDEGLVALSNDPDAVERRALHEVASRAHLPADELDAMRLPHRLVPAADAIGDAAYVIGREAGKLTDETLGNDALTALGSIDLTSVETYYQAARRVVDEACEEYELEDASVYGGGLYL